MTTFVIIFAILAAAAVAVYFGMKTGKIKDADGDLIPDVIEEKVEDVKEVAAEVKKRAQRVKEELTDVANAAKEVVKQAGDVKDAVKGNPRAGRKPRRNNKKQGTKPAGNSSSNQTSNGGNYYKENRNAK